MTHFHTLDPLVTGIDTEILDAQRQVNQMLATFPQPDVLTPQGLAQLRAITAPSRVAPELTPFDVTIAGPDHDLRLHIFTPAGPARAVIVRIHGGGWAAGTPEDDEALNDQIARRCQVAIVSPDYQLVPESSIPHQIDECVAAARWTAAHALVRFGTSRLLLAGTSAGSHLAAATLLRLRDEAEPAFPSIVGMHLDCGAYDLSGTPSMRSATNSSLVLSCSLIDGLVELALPGMNPEARRAAFLAPLYADLSGLPPALFTVGSLDPLRDDTLFLATRWQLDGNQADLDIWPEGAHAFTNMGTPLAAVALDRTTSWISALLDKVEEGSETRPHQE
jgi:acetyl esterase/lipase